MKIGIFGGAFNPPHKGHVKLARFFADKLCLDKVLVIPTSAPVHKSAADFAPAADRLAMCRLAFGGDPRFEISEIETGRPGGSYTVDTLRALRKEFPHAEFYLILGADAYADFGKWREPDEIASMATLCAAARKEGEVPPGEYPALIGEMKPYVISSTRIRQMVKENGSIARHVGARVARYIIQRGLYT